MFELKEYQDGYFSTFYFKDVCTREVWMPTKELRNGFGFSRYEIDSIALSSGEIGVEKDFCHYKISDRFDVLFESDYHLLCTGKKTEPITCIRLTDLCNRPDLFEYCTKVADIQAIYFKEIIPSKTIIKPQLSTFAIFCPHELMVRLEERIDEDDDIPSITEAVVQALTFWLDSETKQTPLTSCEPPSLPLFRREYHLSIGQMADLYYRNFSLTRNQMFNILRAMNIIQQGNTLPRQIYIELGMFDVIANHIDGNTFTQAVLTPKGQVWLPKQISIYFKSLNV